MSYSSAEVKSGFLITLSLILLFALTFVVGRFTGGKTQTWQIQFGYVNGLEDNAPVYFAGHEVGKVDRIEVMSDAEKSILVTVRVSEKVHLREDSQSFIDTLGLMGEKFVELTPGSHGIAKLQPGSVIEGTDPIPMYLLIQKMNLLATRMDEMTSSLNPMMQRFDKILAGQEEDIAKMVANFHETSANLRDMTHDLKFRPWRLIRKGS
jgi:phospholipid/cholesterol/gamma-HCH transport system substrate-binding protein